MSKPSTKSGEAHALRVGDEVKGESVAVEEPQLNLVQFYKTSGLRVIARAGDSVPTPPPWLGVAPALEIYRERGHRPGRLEEGGREARRGSGCRDGHPEGASG